ncbi:aldehyde dehydrogenase family protein [Microbacter sp. GSS18]|nr:aldehyde dehydrogenase family protein [Microbacter sp. GSS18]
MAMLTVDDTVVTDLYIGGEHRTTDASVPVVDPARGTTVGHAASATPQDVAAAVAAAKQAFPGWAALSPKARADLLEAAVVRDEADARDDAVLLSRENGKILAECVRDTSMLQRRTRQVTRLADIVDATRSMPSERAVPTNTEIGYQPLGVVTIIVPFNWPVGILSTALPYALLAGNTVVVKPPPTAPLATTRIVERVAAHLPPGVLNVVTGVDENMTALVRNTDVAKVCFTGSVGGGKRIMALAAESLTRVTLELGGNDAAILLDDAPLDDDHLDRLFAAVFSSTGQICMNAKRIYVHRARLDEVVQGLSDRLSRTVLGEGLDPSTTMGPLHTERQKEFVGEIIAEARDAGATVLEFGELPEAPELRDGHFIRPALVVDPDASLRVVHEEPFGPVVPLIAFDDDETAVELANDSWAGLGGSVWSADEDRAARLGARLECGYVWINDHGAPRLDIRAPFGGMKQSGMGREQGIEGIRAFQDTRAIARLDREALAAMSR